MVCRDFSYKRHKMYTSDAGGDHEILMLYSPTPVIRTPLGREVL